MPNQILKRFLKPEADAYVFQPAAALSVGAGEESAPVEPAEEEAEKEEERQPPSREEDPVSYAEFQAEALLRDVRREAEAYRAEALRALDGELEELRAAARQEGYSQGYAQGMAEANDEGKRRLNEMAVEQTEAVKKFLEDAVRIRDRVLDENREEMKDLALEIAEKVIRVSLKNSGDIILRMVDAATDTHKRCEWARIYVADCDVKGKAYTLPEMAAALGHISDRVRVIPMADDESGTCIVELPDVILDASVSTQLGNIREVLANTGTD